MYASKSSLLLIVAELRAGVPESVCCLGMNPGSASYYLCDLEQVKSTSVSLKYINV